MGRRDLTDPEAARLIEIRQLDLEALRPKIERLARLAKTIAGLVQRVAQRLLALTLGIYLNILCGRPARALAAYDGR